MNGSPAYSMSARLNIAKIDEVPAPNAYDLNKNKVVDTPSYTFAGKGYNPKKDNTPGELPFLRIFLEKRFCCTFHSFSP